MDRSLEAKHEDIVIALIDNEFTVKRLMVEGDKCWLKAENPDYDDIHLNDCVNGNLKLTPFTLKTAK